MPCPHILPSTITRFASSRSALCLTDGFHLTAEVRRARHLCAVASATKGQQKSNGDSDDLVADATACVRLRLLGVWRTTMAISSACYGCLTNPPASTICVRGLTG